MPETKNQYTPSAERRFVVSSDMFSRRRFRVVDVVIKEMKDRCPALVDGVLMGSLSKGKKLSPRTLNETDIDLALVVDPKLVLESHDDLARREPLYRVAISGWRQRDLTFDLTLKGERLAQIAYSNYVKAQAKKRISEKLNGEGDPLTPGRVCAVFKVVATEGEYSIVNQVESAFGKKTDWSGEFENLGDDKDQVRIGEVAVFWGWDLNGSLGTYRRAFLESLREMGSTANTNWSVIDHYVRYWERKLKIPRRLEKYYPTTINDAINFYLDPEAFANSIKT